MPWLATCVLLLCAPPLLGAVVSVLVHGPSRQLLHAAMRTGCLWIAASLAQSGPGRSHATALVKCAWRSRGACCSLLSQDAPTQMPRCLCLSCLLALQDRGLSSAVWRVRRLLGQGPRVVGSLVSSCVRASKMHGRRLLATSGMYLPDCCKHWPATAIEALKPL